MLGPSPSLLCTLRWSICASVSLLFHELLEDKGCVSFISVIPGQCLILSRHWVSYSLKNRCYLPFRSFLIRLPSRSLWEGLLAEWWNSVLGLNENTVCWLDKLTTCTRAFVGMNSSLTCILGKRSWALLTIPQTWDLHAHDCHGSC